MTIAVKPSIVTHFFLRRLLVLRSRKLGLDAVALHRRTLDEVSPASSSSHHLAHRYLGRFTRIWNVRGRATPLLRRILECTRVLITQQTQLAKLSAVSWTFDAFLDLAVTVWDPDISNAGIPTIANQTVQELDGEIFQRSTFTFSLILVEPPVITPYSTMNTMVVNKTVGLAWWHNMVVGKRMQSTRLSSLILPIYSANLSDHQIYTALQNPLASTARPPPLSSHGTVR